MFTGLLTSGLPRGEARRDPVAAKATRALHWDFMGGAQVRPLGGMEVGVMSAFKALRGVGAAARVAISLLLLLASGALAASPVYLCVPTKAGADIKSGGATGTCGRHNTRVALPSEEAEQQKLLSILPYLNYVEKGVGGKPTIQVSGANLQILSGSGKTDGPVNGAGNLIIGYDEAGGLKQTGSHNLVLGIFQTYTSYGAILGGLSNHAEGPYSFVVGYNNRTFGENSSVSGGQGNTAFSPSASVSGGIRNNANGEGSSISGGFFNEAPGVEAWIGGGEFNVASGFASSVSGGDTNKASGFGSAVSGGSQNVAGGSASSVSGGLQNVAGAESDISSVGPYSSILGGKDELVETAYGHFP